MKACQELPGYELFQYVDADGLRRITRAIEAAASRATRGGPLAYLRMEPGAQAFEVRLTIWPGGDDELLALVFGPVALRHPASF